MKSLRSRSSLPGVKTVGSGAPVFLRSGLKNARELCVSCGLETRARLRTYFARWQAAKWPGETSRSAGTSDLHRASATGHRG